MYIHVCIYTHTHTHTHTSTYTYTYTYVYIYIYVILYIIYTYIYVWGLPLKYRYPQFSSTLLSEFPFKKKEKHRTIGLPPAIRKPPYQYWPLLLLITIKLYPIKSHYSSLLFTIIPISRPFTIIHHFRLFTTSTYYDYIMTIVTIESWQFHPRNLRGLGVLLPPMLWHLKKTQRTVRPS